MLAALACIALSVAPLSAADLAKIDRSIGKEPAYKGKPKYCLLVFGPEAKTRVWLVQDGDTLYVDRNGNGDLTEEGEKVAAKKEEDAREGGFSFEAGDLCDGKLTHKNLQVYVRKLDGFAERSEQIKEYLARNPEARGYTLGMDIEMPGWKGRGLGERVEQATLLSDNNGFLKFADRPHDAPVVHFGGPWQILLFGQQKLTVGRETDLTLGVGTPGVGPGTTVWVGYEGVIPEKVYPQVEITYPPKSAGENPVKEQYELKDRC